MTVDTTLAVIELSSDGQGLEPVPNEEPGSPRGQRREDRRGLVAASVSLWNDVRASTDGATNSSR
jgi:hypothetical protein